MPYFTHDEISNLTTKDLRELLYATFGIQTKSNNRPWMIKRISQAPVFAEPVAQALAEVPAEAPVQPAPHDPASATTGLIPPVGSEIRKTWRGKELVVQVQADGFLLKGKVYRSLSAAATALCGGNRNGLVFFGLKPRPAKVVQGTAGAA